MMITKSQHRNTTPQFLTIYTVTSFWYGDRVRIDCVCRNSTIRYRGMLISYKPWVSPSVTYWRYSVSHPGTSAPSLAYDKRRSPAIGYVNASLVAPGAGMTLSSSRHSYNCMVRPLTTRCHTRPSSGCFFCPTKMAAKCSLW